MSGLALACTVDIKMIKKNNICKISQGRPGVWSVVAEILRSEGGRGLLVGSTPRLLRRTIMAALAWTVYEKAMRRAGIK